MTERLTAADGLVVVDKPQGISSHDVVARVRRLAATRKVGHAGTLDPMATGVLVLGVGRATRLLTYLVGADKEYLATIRLGVATSTDDADGEALATAGARDVADDAVAAAVRALTGPISQVPSAVSAIKVDGKRAYARVRAGEDVELAPRPVTIHAFDIDVARRTVVAEGAPGAGTDVVDVDVRVVCSSGTYVRALARDVGAALGVGGHLTRLRRTRVGAIAHAVTLDQLTEATETHGQMPVLAMAEAAAAMFPVRRLDAAEATELGHGRFVPAHDEPVGETVAAVHDDRLVALVERRRDALRPVVVLVPAGG
ncbi:tRNA pseudouridine synthase B [Flavimobilis marinus]|uniref:tRNA pseudouridine synthase B n=1 Tax=Flavimobilis marinus TaxID=285351 RepID=A0A1I2E5U0_9MICO|nr:tRNA pseudouridine(55) synthase TruB [Flavimobilis marinus]GHG43613.1 tRNA pseudouridine synthase B [Flavimobilis marinus]SFE88077.1 tRNA pseudouridine55 synthase [Flavimobilis marinus]